MQGRRRGCRVLVAGAGYGKTTRLESGDGGPVAYHLAADLVDGVDPGTVVLDGFGSAMTHVAVDDFGMLDLPARDRLARALCALPGGVLLSVASHEPLARSTLTALPAPVAQRTAADLAMSADAVAVVLRDEYGVADSELAHHVAGLTAGWPALVGFAGAALARDALGHHDLLAALTLPGSASAAWLHDQVLGGLPPSLGELLGRVAGLDPVTVALCAHLAPTGVLGDPDRVLPGLRWLIQTGLVVPAGRPARDPADQAYHVVPALAAGIARRQIEHSEGGDEAGTSRAAAGWYRDHGYPLAAAQVLLRAGDPDGCVRLIETHGDDMLAAGAAPTARLIAAVPDDDRSDRLTMLLGDALRITGDVTAAMDTFRPLLARAEGAGEWPSALVWRVAMVHYMRSDYRAALEVCRRRTVPDPPVTADDTLVLACLASTLAMLGDRAAASGYSGRALTAATRAGDDRVLAGAHLAMALTEAGGRRDQHLAEAQAAAQRAGDLALLTRVLLNQAVGLAREAQYVAALDVSARAVRAAELGGPPGMHTVALVNAGTALSMLGRFDEAALRFDRAVQLSRRVGLHRVAMGLAGAAELHRLRGQHEQSRALFEEAVDLARAGDDRQVLVAALVKLTRVLLAARDADLPAARAAADEAERLAGPGSAAPAMVAAGYVALAGGDLDTARQRAAAAIAAARSGRRADCLAESLELAAAACADPAEAGEALREAESIWRRGGAVVAADLVLVAWGRLAGVGAERRAIAKAAARRLQALGVRAGDAPPGPADAVRIRVLGGFEVSVGGQPVPLTAWRSRQARSLVKILVARRGRPVPRGELCELLWADDDTRRTAHRLSVLLSMIRSVLDPAHAWPADRHVRADSAGIWLDTERVTVDAEELARDSDLAAQLLQEGQAGRAREVLREVCDRYHGDAFDDEPYEDWARGLREEVRAARLRALRQLVTLSVDAGDLDQAVTVLVRLRVADPFDEPVHRLLVTSLVDAGRHGEARRAFEQWEQAMRSIDVPAPDRGLLRTGAGGGRVSSTVGRRSPGRSSTPRGH